jgi:hypothetical protein
VSAQYVQDGSAGKMTGDLRNEAVCNYYRPKRANRHKLRSIAADNNTT